MNDVRQNHGFTLIEVCFAVLIVGLGLLTIFSLFPSGLRMAEEDLADTKCALFSDKVLAGLHANAAGVTNAADWSNGSFVNKILKDVLDVGVNVSITGTNAYPPSTDDGVRYSLKISDVVPYSATLVVWFGEHGSLAGQVPSVSAYTEFYQSYQAK
ncbi:MAG: prepilin-type N-terminal cleavage/methylation domain-containing protein [bacterium]